MCRAHGNAMPTPGLLDRKLRFGGMQGVLGGSQKGSHHLAPLLHGLRVPFSKVAIPQVFLRPVSGIWHSVARWPRGAEVSCGAGSQLRVPMVIRGGATGSTGSGSTHSWCCLLGCSGSGPQVSAMSPVLEASAGVGRARASPHPPRDRTDSPLSLSRESWGLGPSRLVSGCWPGSGAGIECRPDGWTVQERIWCQQSRSPGSRLSWAAGASAGPRELEPQT